MIQFELHAANSLQFLRGIQDGEVASVVTDPPYEISFMGKKWDGTGVAFQVELWREIYRVLRPGGHVLAFGSTRTIHRMACAIEDAGFEIRDTLAWHYGSGMPKSHDVSKAMDKQAGVVREVGPVNPARAGRLVNQQMDYVTETGWSAGDRKITEDPPATEDAKKWDGWGTALKPATELICLARKPLEGTVVNNVLTHGTGALNIDGCRIPVVEVGGRPHRVGDYKETNNTVYSGRLDGSLQGGSKAVGETDTGRWPANVVHDGSDAVLAQFPDTPGQLAKARSDETPQNNKVYGAMTYDRETPEPRLEIDKSAARFFYCAKPTRKEKGEYNDHPTVKPVALMRWLVRLITPPDGVVLDPFCGSGTTGIAAVLEDFYFVGIDLDPHNIDISERRILNWCPPVPEDDGTSK